MCGDRTAWCRLVPGQALTVAGAAGALGGFAVQLVEADGSTVVADASVADGQLGADAGVRRGDDVADRIRLVVTC